eukprot:UN05170
MLHYSTYKIDMHVDIKIVIVVGYLVQLTRFKSRGSALSKVVTNLRSTLGIFIELNASIARSKSQPPCWYSAV